MILYRLKQIKYWPRQIVYGIKNLIIWFPIIWCDRQWDHMFLLIMLRKKLRLMENYFEDGAVILDTKKVANKIRIARILIERLEEDAYGDFLHEKLDQKFGEGKFNWTPIENTDLSELDITYEKIKTKKDEENHRKEMKRIWEYEKQMREQDKEYFAKIFKKYVDHWWE
jgi:hypothetical protein